MRENNNFTEITYTSAEIFTIRIHNLDIYETMEIVIQKTS